MPRLLKPLLMVMATVALLMAQTTTKVDYGTQLKGVPFFTDVTPATNNLQQFCTSVGAGTLAVTRAWNALATQTIRCNLQFTGGMFQPASGQTITIMGSVTCPTGQRCFDTSVGGAGSVVFTGSAVAQAEWFGLTATDATGATNKLAIQSALYAYPITGTAQGNTPIHQGAVSIGCGPLTTNAGGGFKSITPFLIDGEIFMNAGQNLYSTCTATQVSIKLAGGTFTGTVTPMLAVLPTLVAGTPRPNVTHDVHIRNLTFDCNGANNSGCGGILFYGAETSTIEQVIIANAPHAGLSIGQASDAFFFNPSDAITIKDVWVAGTFGTSTGPGCYIHATGIAVINLHCQHFNTFGSFSGGCVTAQLNPELCIDQSNLVTIDNYYGEFDAYGIQIKNSASVRMDGIQPGTCAAGDSDDCNSTQGVQAIGIFGTNNLIHLQGLQSFFAHSIVDNSSQLGALAGYQYPSGNASTVSQFWYDLAQGDVDAQPKVVTSLSVLQGLNLQQHAVYTANPIGPTMVSGANCGPGELVTDGAGIIPTSGAATCMVTFAKPFQNPSIVVDGVGCSTKPVLMALPVTTSMAISIPNSCTAVYHIVDIHQ